MKYVFFTLILINLGLYLEAQEKVLVGSYGLHYNKDGYMIDMSIGEVIIDGSLSSAYHFSNGFLPHEYLIPTKLVSGKIREFNIYPNPVEDIVQIKGLNSNTTGTVYIYNVDGKLVDKKVLNKNTLSMGDLLPGQYILLLQDGNNAYQTKIVKK